MRLMRVSLKCMVFATVFTSLLAVGVSAAPADGPEITDPEGDTAHREFGWEEPTLDVTQVSFNWTVDGRLEVQILLPNADVLGPEGTMDPFSPGNQRTYVDVYWTMAGEDHLARVRWDEGSGDPMFLAGQGMRIHRQVFWEEGDHIHGDTTEQEGRIESVGDGHKVVIRVDPSAVGSPGPGDLLEAPAFSSYIDHHMPVGDAWPVPHPVGPHHPANADVSDAPGLHFHIPQNMTIDPQGGSPDEQENVPVVGLVWLGVLGALLVGSRRK